MNDRKYLSLQYLSLQYLSLQYLSLSVILSVKSLNTGKHADSRLDPPQPWGRESVANTGNGGHIQGHPHGSPHKWRPGPCRCEPHQLQNPSDRYSMFWAESWKATWVRKEQAKLVRMSLVSILLPAVRTRAGFHSSLLFWYKDHAQSHIAHDSLKSPHESNGAPWSPPGWGVLGRCLWSAHPSAVESWQPCGGPCNRKLLKCVEIS